MEVEKLAPDNPLYPPALAGLSEPPELTFIGNQELLHQPLLAVFCSVKCPASLILKAHDLAKELTVSGQAVISGFQSPVEKEMLTVLLRGSGPIVVCPARGLADVRTPAAWRMPIETGRMLLLSAFAADIKRADRANASHRNLLAASLANDILIIHAEPGSKIEALYVRIQANGKTIKILTKF